MDGGVLGRASPFQFVPFSVIARCAWGIATLAEGTREDGDRVVSVAPNAKMKASGESGNGTR